MNNFFFSKQKYTNKTGVWYDGILIGELEIIIKEKPNIDWPKYRADKTLKLSITDRWVTSWKARTTKNIATLGAFNSKNEAAQAILDANRVHYEREKDDNRQ